MLKYEAISRYLETEDLKYARHLETKDTISLLKAMVSPGNIYKLNLTNKQRKLLTAFIRNRIQHQSKFSEAWIDQCLNQCKEWKGLLHHVHFRPKTTAEWIFVSIVRGDYTKSRNSKVLSIIKNSKNIEEIISNLSIDELIRFKDVIAKKVTAADADFMKIYIRENFV